MRHLPGLNLGPDRVGGLYFLKGNRPLPCSRLRTEREVVGKKGSTEVSCASTGRPSGSSSSTCPRSDCNGSPSTSPPLYQGDGEGVRSRRWTQRRPPWRPESRRLYPPPSESNRCRPVRGTRTSEVLHFISFLVYENHVRPRDGVSVNFPFYLLSRCCESTPFISFNVSLCK